MPAPTPAKLLHVLGLLAKEEATYATAVALTSTADGVQLQFTNSDVAAPFSIDYSFDGNLGPSVGNLGNVKGVAPSGRSIKGDLPTRMRPGGAAYTALVLPSAHRELKASGFDATLSTTTGSESYTYNPTGPGTGFTSLTRELYVRGEKWPVLGCINDLKIDFANPAPPIWTFSTMGIFNALPTDVAAPVITYPNQTVPPPLASSVALTLGNLTSANAAVMSGSFALNRKTTPRVVLSGGAAHLGFMPDDRDPQLKIVLEATALTGAAGTAAATFDPYNLRDLALQIAVVLTFGTTQYNKYTLNLPQAQVIAVVPGNNGSIATVELTIRAFNSTAVSADDVNFVFN